ncbi:hypothetical protein LM900335_170002 [Listeria monocytogenes]|nr:hypothetical protein LM900335_170002 [Listeria monocytogenes]
MVSGLASSRGLRSWTTSLRVLPTLESNLGWALRHTLFTRPESINA